MRLVSIRSTGTIAVFAVLFAAHPQARAAGQWEPAASAFSIPAAQQMQPEELNRLLRTRGAEKPLMFQVGSRVLFAEAHIPGSEYAGPGSQPEGLDLLRSRVERLNRKSFIVLYCGCCPWNRCPNIGPAYQLLHSMGFTRVKVLYLAGNFGTDWASKGYPVAHGQ
jgi:thiosulfate/3-mercaptopyruvate sulfurtransferase